MTCLGNHLGRLAGVHQQTGIKAHRHTHKQAGSRPMLSLYGRDSLASSPVQHIYLPLFALWCTGGGCSWRCGATKPTIISQSSPVKSLVVSLRKITVEQDAPSSGHAQPVKMRHQSIDHKKGFILLDGLCGRSIISFLSSGIKQQ